MGFSTPPASVWTIPSWIHLKAVLPLRGTRRGWRHELRWASGSLVKASAKVCIRLGGDCLISSFEKKPQTNQKPNQIPGSPGGQQVAQEPAVCPGSKGWLHPANRNTAGRAKGGVPVPLSSGHDSECYGYGLGSPVQRQCHTGAGPVGPLMWLGLEHTPVSSQRCTGTRGGWQAQTGTWEVMARYKGGKIAMRVVKTWN